MTNSDSIDSIDSRLGRLDRLNRPTPWQIITILQFGRMIGGQQFVVGDVFFRVHLQYRIVRSVDHVGRLVSGDLYAVSPLVHEHETCGGGEAQTDVDREEVLHTTFHPCLGWWIRGVSRCIEVYRGGSRRFEVDSDRAIVAGELEIRGRGDS